MPNFAGNRSFKDLTEVAWDVNLCRHNIHPSHCAGDCQQLHLCRLFVADMCPYAETCRSGHKLNSSHNTKVLKERGLKRLSEGELMDAISAGYLARCPITDLERRFALQVCRSYLNDDDCEYDEYCLRLHVCDEYVARTCANSSGCGLSHNLVSADNAFIIRRAGLSSLSHGDLLEVLDDPPTVKNVWLSISPCYDSVAPSSDFSLLVGSGVEVVVYSASGVRQRAPNASGMSPFTEPRRLTQDVNLCRYNIYPARCPGDCQQLHLCRLFVAGMCPYAETCRSGHKLLNSSHNVKVLKDRGVERLPEGELLEAIEAGYLARNPITDLERRFALQVCHAYLDDEDCEDENCTRVHVCDGYVARTCANGSGCELSHNLVSADNAAIIRRTGLSSLSHGDLLEVLDDPPTAKNVWMSLSSCNDCVAPSSDPSRPVGSGAEGVIFSAPGVHQRTPNASGKSPFTDPRCLAQDVNLCRYNIYPSRCPGYCQQLHLCRLFVADMCPYAETCRSGHKLNSSHNTKVLKERGLKRLSEGELLDAIRAGYLARCPITDLERRFALQVCRSYLDDDDCEYDEDCLRLHVCDGYVARTCANSSGCGLSHNVVSTDNAAIIRRAGLSSLSHGDLLDVLDDPPTARNVWLSLDFQ